MEFTESQKVYLNFLLERLNFSDQTFKDRFTYHFIKHLQKSALKFKNIANCSRKEIIYKGEKKVVPENGLTSIAYKDNGDFFEALGLSIFQYLQLEINIRNRKWYRKLSYSSKTISATDISNFTFCPVNFSISKSLYFKTLESTEKGTELHEKSILNEITKKDYTPTKNNYYPWIDSEQSYKSLKDQLDGFEILYSDHASDDKSRIFKSKNEKYSAKPDYILINKAKNKIIVVEEKYYQIPKQFYSYGDSNYYDEIENKINNKRNKVQFHQNHIYQVLSYIYGIQEYKIDYGLLVYWKYEYDDDGDTIVTKCNFKKIHRNEKSRENLNQIFKEIKDFKKSGELSFDPNIRNPKKCANCVHNYLCGHKTGKFHKLTFPYNEKFLQTKFVSYPEEFKSDSSKQENKDSYLDKIIYKLDETKNLLDLKSLEDL